MLYEKQSKGTIDQVCAKVEEYTVANKFGVIQTIDLKKKMESKGVVFGPECRIIEVCNPVQAKAVLEQDMSISTALPCRISVYQKGNTVTVSTLRPTKIFSLFGKTNLTQVAQTVEETLIRIIDSACT